MKTLLGWLMVVMAVALVQVVSSRSAVGQEVNEEEAYSALSSGLGMVRLRTAPTQQDERCKWDLVLEGQQRTLRLWVQRQLRTDLVDLTQSELAFRMLQGEEWFEIYIIGVQFGTEKTYLTVLVEPCPRKRAVDPSEYQFGEPFISSLWSGPYTLLSQ